MVSPAVSIPSGFVRRSQNYEQDINGGYVTLTGYERVDGRPAPSAAIAATLMFSSPGTIAVGNTITGATSGATGKVIAITATAFILTKLTGTFVTESTTTGSASIVGPAAIGSASGALGAQYKNLAADSYRADITIVPGSGNILGVWYYKADVYAFRNNAAATAVDMYKASASGWTIIALGFEVYFTSASGTAPAEGATITKGGTSAILKRLVIESGSFGAGTAAGRLIFASITAGPFTAGAFTGGIVATCASQANITIPNINGRFEFINANFSGSIDSYRVYGCDGVNRGFEFDGTTFVPINTGIAQDKPSHVVAHQNHLFFSIKSSVFNSAIGDPYNWTALLGASETALSDTVTGFMPQPGSEATPAMAIYSRNKTDILYGSSAASWQLTGFNDQAGAIPYSMQKIGQTYVFDDRGITSLATAQQFGNFLESTISKRVDTLLRTKRAQTTDSHTSKDKQQYRLFFGDGSAVYWTIGSKIQSMMSVLFPVPVLCSTSQEAYGGGDELIYFGSSDGFIYQMERGTSFDGEPIEAYFEMVFDSSKSYRMLKKYRRITFEMTGTGYAEFNSTYDLAYSSTEFAQPDYILHVSDMTSATWDSGSVFDAGVIWDGLPLSRLTTAIAGNGDSIAIKIRSISDYFTPLKFSGALVQFSLLRNLR